MSAVTLAVLSSAAAAALVARVLVPVPTRLARRVRPYVGAARSSLGRAVDLEGPLAAAGGVRRLLAPLVESAMGWLGQAISLGGDDALALRLRQAGLFLDLPAATAVMEYRVRTLLALGGGAVAAVALAITVRASAPTVVGLGACGAVVGATRWRGRLDRAIEDRRERIRIELYTVNQLLAMHLRCGGGITQACRRLVERGNGLVIDELGQVLRLHASGMPMREALTRAATATPEPMAARTYRLLAAGADHGADLADALLGHADDVRAARREALKRQATRRRAAMLLPIVGILAPVMLLFIAAPIPSIVFGVR